MTVEPRKIAKPEVMTLLKEYASEIVSTDRLPPNNLQPALMGLFGEVGSLMATSKKRLRDADAYTEYYEAVCEEFGDVLWYLGAICRRLRIKLEDVFFHALNDNNYNINIAASDLMHVSLSQVLSVSAPRQLEDTLIRLGKATSSLFKIETENEEAHQLLKDFTQCYLQAIQAVDVPFPNVVQGNIHKTQGSFIAPNLDEMPVFDANFEREEQLPWEFEIEITQRKSGQSYLRWKGVFIGDPLSDNILDEDGYRYHDIFHFSHAAILHWSPTFRALIKQKRKSNEVIDKAQDGGRAIVIEEGLTAYIFSRAKKLEFFAQQDRVSYDLLKIIQQFVRGYEVEDCPPSLWERAILQGYDVFRQVHKRGGGLIIGNRKERTIIYKASSKG